MLGNKIYQPHELTSEILTKMFGDSCDWYSVLKNGKRVGSFSDLRKIVIKKQEDELKKAKRKSDQNILNQKNTLKSISDAKRFFESEFKDSDVFINRTQPNLIVNGSRCYIICGPTDKIRLGILHKSKTFDDMLQESGVEGLPNASKNHILFDGLTLEDAKSLIKQLCD